MRIRCTSKPHAHFQTMTKIPEKFQKNWHRIVGVLHKFESTDRGTMQAQKSRVGIGRVCGKGLG